MDPLFQESIARVRDGDAEAAAEIVRRIEPELSRFIHLKVESCGDLRSMDSVDISQSVWCGIFEGLAKGHFAFENSQELLHLAKRMAVNKLLTCRRREAVRKIRDEDAALLDAMPSKQADCADELCYEELLGEVRRRLSDDEAALADGRTAGKDWKEIADEIGSSPDAARKQLERAVRRVCEELGLPAMHR